MYNLNGSVLRIGQFEEGYDYDVKILKLNGTIEYIGGYALTIFLELSKYLNFSFIVINEVLPYEYIKLDNFSIDLLPYSQSLLEWKSKIVSPTFVTGKSKLAVFLNREFESTSESILFDPFDKELWFAILCLFLIISLALIITSRFEKILITKATFHSIAILLQKDTDQKFKFFGPNLIIWICGIATIFFVAAYSGNFYSILAVKKYSINSLESLARSKYDIFIEVGYNTDSVIQYIAEKLSEYIPVMKKLLAKASKSKFVFESFEKSIKQVINGRNAYIIDQETVFFIIQNQFDKVPCTFSKFSFAGINYPWSWFAYKNSTYLPAINYGLLKFDQVGIRDRQWKRYIPNEPKCKEKNDFKVIDLSKIRECFYIYIVGLILSFFIFIFEKYTSRNKTL